MEIIETKNADAVQLSISGRLDTLTAPELESKIATLSDANTLEIDMKNLTYVSSAGLRVLLSAHKVFSKKGGLTLKNLAEQVKEVFEVTGFNDVLNIL